MNLALLWRQWYREARRKSIGRRELNALSDHLRRDIGVPPYEPVTSASARRTKAASAPAARNAVVLHLLQAGGPDTPQVTLGPEPKQVSGNAGTHAA